MSHTNGMYHYESSPTLEDYHELETRLSLEERRKMNEVIYGVISIMHHSSYENRLLAEKFMKMGYLYQYMKPMNFREYPPTEPPK